MYLPGPIPMFIFINVFAWANPLVEIYQCICLGKCPCLIYQCICLGQSPCLNLSMYLPGPIHFFCKESAKENWKSKFGFLTSESVRGHHDKNFEWSQAEPFSKYEHARAFLRFLDFFCKESARNNWISKSWFLTS